MFDDILDKLTINADQRPFTITATDNITMAAKREKYISHIGTGDRRSIPLTLCESSDGMILPFQLISKDKWQDRYQKLIFPKLFGCDIMKNTGAMKSKPFASLMTFYFHIIWDVLHDLAPFVQFKKREKHSWRSGTA